MGGAARAGRARLAALALLACGLWPARADNASQEYYTALINVTVAEPGRGAPLTFRIDRGRYGLDSPKAEVRGQVLAPLPIHGVADHLGCDPQTRFFVPPNIKQWIALLQRGNCTFKEKISRAAFHNAVAVVIYNNKSKEEPVTMTHPGTGDIIAVMITELRGKDILSYLEKNISVQMTIAVGTRMPPKNFSRGSLVFVSISFIVLMIISSAWLIFYFIQKIRYTNARDRNQRRLGDAAKKAISKLTTRTVKKGDKETDPDFDHCAVCIESYKQNDVVRILPCKHVFHKSCVDPWLSEHCTCPMCKLNILKALGIVVCCLFCVAEQHKWTVTSHKETLAPWPAVVVWQHLSSSPSQESPSERGRPVLSPKGASVGWGMWGRTGKGTECRCLASFQ